MLRSLDATGFEGQVAIPGLGNQHSPIHEGLLSADNFADEEREAHREEK